MSSLPNLARRPFVNRRPVQRLALLLWLVGAAAFLANVALYWRYVTGAGRRQGELAQIAGEAERERRALEEQREGLSAIDLAWQNDQVRFLNGKIAQRSFPWSELFDQLADVLPRGVRLSRLQPNVAETEAPGGRALESYGETVALAMNGGAESGEQLYAFLDALYAHQAFERPSLARETRDDAEVEFNLTVTYLPGAAEGGEEPERAPGVEPPEAEALAGVEPAPVEAGTPEPALATLAEGVS